MFQHRHYVAIAAVIANMPSHSPRLWTTREEMTGQLADLFARDNPRFDRARFEAACQGKPINGRDKIAA